MRLRSQPLLLAALLALGLAGCDGGVSGTGLPPIDASDSATIETGGDAGSDDGAGQAPGTSGDEGGDAGGETGGDDGAITGDNATDGEFGAVTAPLENVTAVRAGPPTLDLFNASAAPITVVRGPERRPLADVPAGEAIEALTLPNGSAPLQVLDEDGAVLAVFDPVTPVGGSLTRLLVRDSRPSATAVIALPLRLSPNDPALALVRVALGNTLTGTSNATDSGPIALRGSDGAASGSPIAFAPLDEAAPASDYVAALPGRYSIDANGRTESVEFDLTAGTAVTLVLLGDGSAFEPLPLLDGRAVAAAYLDTSRVGAVFDSGLRVESLVNNPIGATVAAGDTVTVHYTGRLLDGTLFDSSFARGEPARFPLGGVIEGFRETLLTMRVGERVRAVLPPNLAYGTAGSPPGVPPEATLVFEIDLLGVD